MTLRTGVFALVLAACARDGRDPSNDDGSGGDTEDTPVDTTDGSDSDEEEDTDEASNDTDPLPECDADLEIYLLGTGERVPLRCVSYLAEATFEYDPDTRPEIRTAHIEIVGRTGVDVECRIVLDLEGLCRPAFYEVPRALRASVQTFDCAGIPDNMEGEFALPDGYAHLDEVRTNGAVGAASGTPLKFNISGWLELLAPGDLVVSGTFDVEPTVIGRDAEENDCLGVTQDPGEPVLSGDLDLTVDYKRAFEATNPDCSARVVHDNVLRTVNHAGCPGCTVVGTVQPRLASGDCEIDTDAIELGVNESSGQVWQYDDRGRQWVNVSGGVIGYRTFEGGANTYETNRYTSTEQLSLRW